VRTRSIVALGLVLSLFTACGARLDSKLRSEAVNGALSRSSGEVSLNKQSASEVSGDTATGSGDATSGNASTGGGSTGGGSSGNSGSGATGGGNVGAPASGDNGGATDVGVTGTLITLGNVADLTGPVPGLFQAAPYGAEAYFAYVNSQGGLFGRQLKLIGADAQTDCTANQNAHTNLIPKVFAFAGSFSLYDDCGTKTLLAHPEVPDLSYALGPETKKNTTSNYPPQVAPLGYPNGMFCAIAQKYPDKVKKVGSIYGNIPSAATSQKMIENAAKTCGWQWTDSIAVGASDTTFNAAVNKMQQDGVQLVFLIGTTAGSAAEMKREWDAQANGDAKNALWYVPIAYASDFIQRLGSAQQAEGIIGHNLYSMFFSADDAKNIPEVALFQTWMKRVHPGAALELYAMYSWAAAKLFVQAAKAVGPKLTRKALFDELKKIHEFDGGGIVNQSDIGAHKPSTCYLFWQIHNGAYQRMDTPADHYRCDGTFVPYGG
jgi:ABC-type branched-subunit amino acid transport system substrate-binding protein